MTIDFNQLALLALLGTSIHWLFARSAIMKWFWDLRWWPRARIAHLSEGTPTRVISQDNGLLVPKLANFVYTLLACTACAGFWLGIAGGLIGMRPLELGPGWVNVISSGLAGIVTVPILEGLLVWGLRTTRID